MDQERYRNKAIRFIKKCCDSKSKADELMDNKSLMKVLMMALYNRDRQNEKDEDSI